MDESTKVKLNIGSGIDVIEGYTSVDLYTEADIKDDITTLSTIADNSVDEVLTAHVLEHLKNDDILPAMKSIHRVLKIGGIWEIEVPDFIWIVEDFIKLQDHQRWGWKLQTIFGLQNHDGEYHKTGFSSERLHAMLCEAGFFRIKIENKFSEKYNQGVIDVIATK
jgi:predicted SAM-dependent methyltransferase